MKLRSLLLSASLTSVAVGLVATLVALSAVHEENRTSVVRTQAQEASHEVSGLLVLTQEYARHAEPRAAEQWHQRQAAIAKLLGTRELVLDEDPALTELRDVNQSLPELFEALEKIPQDDRPFNLRRKEVLMDQLLTSTQAMSDHAYQWFQSATVNRRAADKKFQYAALTTLATMLLILLSLVFLVHRRVLRPLRRLDEATAAMSRGDMTQRVASQAQDELGDLSRRFDTMTQTLELNRQQLHDAAKRLRVITDNVPSLIAYIDRDLRYQFTNAYFQQVLAMDPRKLMGKRVVDVMGPGDYASLQPYLEAALAGTHQHFERVNIVRGKAVCLLTDYVPDRNEAGDIVGIFATAKDITELKEIQRAYAQGEQRLRAITNNIPAMVGHFDAEERCLFANDTVLKLQGIDAKDASKHTLRSGLRDDIYAQHQPYVQRVLQGEICGFEGHIQRNGQDVYFQAHLVPDRDAQGQVQGFYLMSFDVTKVRRAEQERKRSEQRLRQITDNLPVLISYIDKDERLQFANKTYQTWLGVDPQAMLGRTILETVGPELYAPRRPYLQRALRGENVRFEAEADALGIHRHLDTNYLPDIDADGKVLGIYTLTTDVSELKTYERQLQALARFDSLTGLPNRLQFNEKMAEALERAQRSKDGLALMFLDVDRFKAINDTMGHAAGDAVLREFAKRLQSSVRQIDVVARLAGDEFVVILEGLHSSAEAEAVARKIVEAAAVPMDVDGQALRVTTSVGVAFQDHTAPALTVPQLLARADEALYDAKAAGRNTFHMA
jgi:diguanylate cyclase (GGDEF)-like protein/PAS domain S-box-containing protein